MIGLEVLFCAQIITGVVLIILLKKMLQMKKQVEDVIKEIQNYITIVTEEEEVTEVKDSAQREKAVRRIEMGEDRDALENKLIQSVLGEYFL